ncbi:uncharacterized protein TNCV_2479171 [Trichonephila clavipes]|nr:uncharacterized protein TNCV_2479171 [Trichonephila clavipes]
MKKNEIALRLFYSSENECEEKKNGQNRVKLQLMELFGKKCRKVLNIEDPASYYIYQRRRKYGIQRNIMPTGIERNIMPTGIERNIMPEFFIISGNSVKGKFTCRNCGGGDRGRVAIYRPFGEVSLSLNRTVTCMVLKANDRRTSCPCHDEFRGPRSDYVRQVALATTTTNIFPEVKS